MCNNDKYYEEPEDLTEEEYEEALMLELGRIEDDIDYSGDEDDE